MEGCSLQSELLSLFNSVLPMVTDFYTNPRILVSPLVAGKAWGPRGSWETWTQILSLSDVTWFQLGEVAAPSRSPFPACKIRGFTRSPLDPQQQRCRAEGPPVLPRDRFNFQRSWRPDGRASTLAAVPRLLPTPAAHSHDLRGLLLHQHHHL